ncbi:MAG: hypothetical protein E6Q92_00600 [Burkholderiaceae bacterium]|nr:MAG: hypothetical protein E6Q92_00600 [Burkholderiaceae bacterium]
MIPWGEMEPLALGAVLPGRPLHTLSTIFLAASVVHPHAVILLAGPSTLADKARHKLAHSLFVPFHKMQVVPLSAPQYTNQIAAIIDFSPEPALFALSKASVVEFQVDVAKYSVDFEISPDGTYVEEVKAQWDAFKILLKGRALLALGGPIAVGTKLVSVFAFDRVAAHQVESSIKEKIQVGLKVGEASDRRMQAEFFGAAGLKLQDGSTKPFFEVGLKLSVPFSFP